MAYKTALKAYSKHEDTLPDGTINKGLYPYYGEVYTDQDIHHAGKWHTYKHDPTKIVGIDPEHGADRKGFSVTSVDRKSPEEYPKWDRRKKWGIKRNRLNDFKDAVEEIVNLDLLDHNWGDYNRLFEVQLKGDIQHGVDILEERHKPGRKKRYRNADNPEEHVSESVKPYREIELMPKDRQAIIKIAFDMFGVNPKPDVIVKKLRDPAMIKRLRENGYKPKTIRNMRNWMEQEVEYGDGSFIRDIAEAKTMKEEVLIIRDFLEAAYAQQAARDAVEEHARSRNAVSDEALKVFTRKYQ
jgi:hypothetical protein